MNADREAKIKEFWDRNNIYQKVKKKSSRGKKFYFLDGPPYATGSIHIGTAWNKILKDCCIRYWRMQGLDVWDQPGYDTHGLPIENQVEKEMEIRSKADIERLGIEKFILSCQAFATRYIDVMSKQFEDLGVWMDWGNPYLTLTNDYIEGAWHTFKIAYQKGLLYHGLYPVHVCFRCETAVAYNEIEYTKVTDPSIYVKFPLVETRAIPEFLAIWTTTPWTLPANVAIMAHPDEDYVKILVDNQILIMANALVDDVMKKIGAEYKIIETFKGKVLEGIKYRHPLAEQFFKVERKVVLSEQYVTMETGTGLVHTAPGHGQEDYRVGLENKLPVISPVKMNGTYDDRCGKYKGIFVKHADQMIIDDLKSLGLLLHEEKINHDYPQCWRCSSALLQMSVPQWFFKVTAIRKKLIEENKKVQWHPDWAGKRFDNWLRSLGDWPISRQRYWGIPLPIWICEKCSTTKVIGSRKELPKVPKDFHRPYIDEITMNCKCGSTMHRIPDVLDVWFDSGLASWASLGYPGDKKLFKRLWPSELQIEGPDQIRGWWNSELITSIITFGRAPFRHILFHGFLLDAHGIKMSKSKGNFVAPADVIKKYGRDTLRLYFLSSAAWDDFYFNWQEADRVAKMLTVIENSFNFVKMYSAKLKPSKPKPKLNVEDKWILSRLNSVIDSATKAMSTYNVHKAALGITDFIINDFSRWYIKIIRDRVWPDYHGKDKLAAFYTMNEVAETCSKLLAPLCPFIAEQAHKQIEKKPLSVHMHTWPKAGRQDKKLESSMLLVKSIVEAASAIRQEHKIKLRWPLQKIVIKTDKRLKQLEDVIKFMCNVKAVEYGEAELPSKEIGKMKIYLDTQLTDELKREALLREIVRKVQELRKRQKLVVKDRIKLTLEGCDELKVFENELKNEVGAKTVIFGHSKKQDKLDFEGKNVFIDIEKL